MVAQGTNDENITCMNYSPRFIFSDKVKLFLWLFPAWQKSSELFVKSPEDTACRQYPSGDLSHLIALLQHTAKTRSQNVPRYPAYFSSLFSPSTCHRYTTELVGNERIRAWMTPRPEHSWSLLASPGLQILNLTILPLSPGGFHCLQSYFRVWARKGLVR